MMKYFAKYRCVPKIASPEERNKFSKKNALGNILVYLELLRRRRENKIVRKRIGKYFSVPKIASPEARKHLIKKHALENVLVYLKSLRRRRETKY